MRENKKIRQQAVCDVARIICKGAWQQPEGGLHGENKNLPFMRQEIRS